MSTKTVKLVQGIWCPGRGGHIVRKGEPYLTLPDGRIMCPECAYDEDEQTTKAGSLG